MRNAFRFAIGVLALGLAATSAAAEQASPEDESGEALSAQLRALAAEHGFRIQGIDKLADAPAEKAAGAVTERLRALLDGHNHVIERSASGVTRVIITSAKTPAESGFSLKTSRKGSHHAVVASLHGAPGYRTDIELLVDTGASRVILPASLISRLGFRAGDLPDQEAQTVNGRLTGKSARLERLSVGGASATGVDVLFVADDRLGGTSLLGMSFLEHFTLTIDDADSRMVLTPR